MYNDTDLEAASVPLSPCNISHILPSRTCLLFKYELESPGAFQNIGKCRTIQVDSDTDDDLPNVWYKSW